MYGGRARQGESGEVIVWSGDIGKGRCTGVRRERGVTTGTLPW